MHDSLLSRNRGDKALGERVMIVDLCNRDGEEGYEDVVAYYKAHFRNADGTYKPIFRFVCTHPHHDHIYGLKKLFDDSDIRVYNFWDLEHSFVPADFEGDPQHEDDWKTI